MAVSFLHILRWSTCKFYFYPPLDTRHKLSVHKTFRRRAGSLLNVLSAFNLRIVSRGIELMKKDDLTIY